MGIPSSLLRSSSAFLFLEKKEKEEERNAANEGEFRIQERKREGKRDGCSRYPFSAPQGGKISPVTAISLTLPMSEDRGF